ncbi:MAG: DMT family transporter [Synergistaceae bacterium]|jgi:drug/metabolite transporter (DMT)-like permease|nr:DMT family transporter [Synergistaceae bacterium]
MKRQAIGTAMLMTASFIWGMSYVAQSIGMNHTGPAAFITARFLLGGAALLPVIFAPALLANKKYDGTAGARFGNFPLRSGIFCGVVLFLLSYIQQVGMIYTTVGKAGFITTLYIVIVPVLGLFFGRKIRLLVWGCAFAALVGMYLLCVNESAPLNKGDLYVLVCAFFAAVHILMIDHYSTRVDALRFSAIQFFVCGGIGLIIAFLTETPSWAALWAARLPIAYTAVMSSGVAFTLQTVAQRRVTPMIASLVMSLEAVFAALTGWLVLRQVLSAREFLGCAVIFASVIAAQTPDMSERGRLSRGQLS